MTSRLTTQYAEALAYAAEIHSKQLRKGPDEIPYTSHLLAVSSLVLEAGGTEDEAIAALLHDAGEDQGGEGRLDDIRERFGAQVAGIVRQCSDSLTDDPDDKASWRDRKRAHLEHLHDASPSTLLVTAADKLHNARSLVTDLQQYGWAYLKNFNAKPRQIVWYYQQIYAVLIAKAAPVRLTSELGHCVLTLSEIIESPRYLPLHTMLGDWIRAQAARQSETKVESMDFDHLRHSSVSFAGHDPARERAVDAVDALQASGLSVKVHVWTSAEHWQVSVLAPTSGDFVAAFRSDDTWVTLDGRISSWSSVKEGSPETVGLGMAADYWRLRPSREAAFDRYARDLPYTQILRRS